MMLIFLFSDVIGVCVVLVLKTLLYTVVPLYKYVLIIANLSLRNLMIFFVLEVTVQSDVVLYSIKVYNSNIIFFYTTY